MHSIIIPHRDRNENLAVCLASIAASAEVCQAEDREVIVVDSCSQVQPVPRGPVRVVVDSECLPVDQVRIPIDGTGLPLDATIPYDSPQVKGWKEAPLFNKPRLVNRGIGEAKGDILTFLDADAIVGPRWMAGVETLRSTPDLTRLCYRVRTCDYALAGAVSYDAARRALFAKYGQFPIAYEAYGHPDRPYWRSGAEPWGNSQFSVRREVLGDLRMDEDLGGHGPEDLDFLMQFYERFGKRYRGQIMTTPETAMLHQTHAYRADWNNQDARNRVWPAYRAKWAHLKDAKP